jgi:hypothetical protein
MPGLGLPHSIQPLGRARPGALPAVHPAPPVCHCGRFACLARSGAGTASGAGLRQRQCRPPVRKAMHGVVPAIFRHAPPLPASATPRRRLPARPH